MATEISRTSRIILKNDTLENWLSSAFESQPNEQSVLKKGELVLVQIPSSTVAGENGSGEFNPPQYLAKIGDGKTSFSGLKWLAAPASDVYAWAKAENKPVYAANEITGIGDFISDYVETTMGITVDTNTVYKLVRVSDTEYKLQSKAATDAETAWADVAGSVITIPTDAITNLTKRVAALEGITGVDAIVVTDADSDNDTVTPKVALKLDNSGNVTLSQSANGLKADVAIPAVPAYSIEKDSNSGNYAAVYHLTKDGVNVGAAINIPKDMVVESGSVVENPEGQTAGTYIKLVLQNVEEPLYINVGSLIEYVTSGSAAGDMVVIAVSDDHKVTATITDGTVTLAKLDTDTQAKINKAHEHSNKSLLDTYTQTEANLADAVSKKHEHSNKNVIDGISADDVNKWDAALQESDITTGSANGTIKVKDTDVAVKGLGTAAYKAEGDFATAAQGAKADTAVQEIKKGAKVGVITVDGTDVDTLNDKTRTKITESTSEIDGSLVGLDFTVYQTEAGLKGLRAQFDEDVVFIIDGGTSADV